MTRFLRLLLLTISAAACSTTGLDPDDPQERTYERDRDRVYDAMVSACRQEGLEIQVAEPHRLRVEGRDKKRLVILQGIEVDNGVTVRIGMLRAKARDFERLWNRIDAELEP